MRPRSDVFMRSVGFAAVLIVLLCLNGRAPARATTWCDGGATLLEEGFESGNFNRWSVWRGSWSVVSGYGSNLSVMSGGADLSVLEYPLSAAQMSIEYDLRIANSDNRADGDIWINVIDVNNYYAIALHRPGESVDQIALCRNGVYTVLTWRTPVMDTAWHHVRVERDADGWIRVYLDDSLHMQAQDTSISEPGAFALRAWFGEVCYDNIKFTDCAGGGNASLMPFSDVTAEYPGLEDFGSGNSVAWVDFDNDGDLDLSVGAGANNPNRLFLNRLTENGTVSFDSVIDPLIANSNTTRGLGWGIFGSGDNCPDLYQGAPFAPNVLLNNSCGAVTDVSNAVTAGSSDQTNGVRVVDFDNDGRLDIHELRPAAPDRLLRNLDNWQFEEMPASALSIVDGSFDAAWADVDNDGDQDVYVVREASWPNVLLRNDGNGVFVDVTPALLGLTDRSQGATWGDYDNDGDLDLFVTNWLAGDRLFRNEGGFGFTDVSVPGMAEARRGQSAVWGDLNNDGWLDLYVANQGDPNQMWLNVNGAGGRTFVEVTPLVAADLGNSTGMGLADYDQDGDLDIYVGAHLGANTLLRNELASGAHWLEVNLEATLSNASAVGALVAVVAGAQSMMREVGANNGMWSQEPGLQHFGLGANAGPVQVTVIWPSGAISDTTLATADQIVSIGEPRSLVPPETHVLFSDDFDAAPDPTWVQPYGGWEWVDGHIRNTTTCGVQSCMPDIWGGGPQYSDYLVSFDLKLSAGNLQLYVMADLPSEHEQGQTGGYAVDVGVGNGNCGGYLNRILPWPNVQRLTTQAGSAFCFDKDVVYRVKCGRIGSQILYKAWPKSAPEPTAWQLRATDDTHHSGYWGISFWNGMGWIDNFVIEGPGDIPAESVSCLKFDGLDDGAHAAATDLPTGANDRTLEFWIKSDNFQQYAFIAGWGSFDATNRSSAIRVGRFEANRRLFFWVYGVDDLVSTTDLQDGMWYHVALTFRDNMASLYLNGELDCEGLRPGLDTPAGTEFWLANCPVWPGAFAGSIDEVRVWNRALSPEEIRAKMNSHLVAGAEAGLVLYWPMNEGMGGFVHDFSRRGNYGKVIGAQWSSGVSFHGIDVVDVPGDQGGALRLSWPAFPADVVGASNAITEYEVQRFGSGTWAAIATIPATQAVSYQTVVQTSDVRTVGQAAPYASYRVAAHTSSADETYYSIVKSAYSIDNVAPPKPAAVLVDDLNYRYVTWANPGIADFRNGLRVSRHQHRVHAGRAGGMSGGLLQRAGSGLVLLSGSVHR
jgi:hypothetical protein